MSMMKRRMLMAVVLCAIAVSAQAAPQLRRETDSGKGRAPVAFKPCRTMPSDMRESLQARGAIRRSGEKGIIAATTKKILVLPVQFTVGPKFSAGYEARASAFFSSFRNYYYENSYALFTVSATIVSSVTLSDVSNYNNETDLALTSLRDNALAKLDGVYGGPPGGYAAYDYIMFYHAGSGQEESGVSADLWSLFYPTAYTKGGKAFNGFTVVPDSISAAGYSPLGVICHEFGHQLGLPDLYDTSVSGGKSNCGCWSVMDYPYGTDNSGNPPHLDVWSKNFVKFIDLPSRPLSGSVAGEFGDIETAQTTGYYKIPLDVAGDSEYFIAEYRDPDSTRMKYDLTAPGTGIIIWHIDDGIALDASRLNNNTVNTGVPHLGVAIVPAIGSFALPGKPTDAFVAGSAFTAPQSNAYDGTISGVAVSDISIASGRATAKMKRIAARSALSIAKIISYPNPAGEGYPHPRSAAGTIATFVANMTRPSQNVMLDIYSLAGERVRAVPKGQFALQLAKSTDYLWVYEFDWNGKNDANEDVAPGVYLYRIKSDTVVKTGKMVIVR